MLAGIFLGKILVNVWIIWEFGFFSVSILNENYNKEAQMDHEKKEKTEFILPEPSVLNCISSLWPYLHTEWK